MLSVLLASGLCYIDFGASEGDDDSTFYIEDSNGNLIEFNQSANNVVVLGYGYALSVIELGCKDKIVAVDSYTSNYLTEYGETGFDTLSIGNFYNSDGCQQIATAILQMSGNGTFNLETDWIIAPGYSSITKSGGLIDVLNETLGEGKYNLITLVGTATTYGGVMDIIESLGKILGADSSDIIDQMSYVEYMITNTVETNNLSGAALIQMSSSGKIYNSSLLVSIATDILNGVNAGNNGTTTASYSTDNSAILQMASQYSNTVIFVDGGYTGSIDTLKTVLENYDIVLMDKEWNNICPQVSEGLWTIACALYPDYFSGDVPTVEKSNDNTLLYLGVGIAVASIVAVIAVVMLRRP